MTNKTKVFCIGFHKTGTSSFTVAMRKLGYSVTGPDGVTDKNIAENVLKLAMERAEKFDAFQDNPWPIIYKEVDKAFPGSKFVLSVRDPQAWVKSLVNHFGKKSTPMREWIYGKGCPKGNEELYLNRFNQHNAEVIEYFSDRPNDLLIMNFTEGDGWEKLCPFLGKAIPREPFPNVNRASERSRFNINNIKLKAKSFISR
ncbi:hypothetical protein OPS25_01985 [Alteromonas ponticola]|uniref:Sulfotransferase family protein n=1 Tax=Alteromonas aquimaris TaxID=2998417 RepID=A0ABT3P3E3_9ALTE|nr:sulfotransferase [Alteromonas aquimaris]MCW8107273.1 hypothetical protein [Alteromonas aquimaris]